MMCGQKQVKHERSCIVCALKGEKSRMLRVVRKPQGGICFDATGRCAGRGAYVCSLACLGHPSAPKRLERAVKTTISREEYDRIVRAAHGAVRGLTG